MHRTRSSCLLSRASAWRGVLVLNYHRIGNPATATGLRDIYSATADDFDHQLSFLKRNTDVISAADLPSVLHRKRGRHVLLTFDDGYRDNYEIAYRLLSKHGLTAAFFVCTGLVDRQNRAWWDDIARLVGSREQPEKRDAAIARAVTEYRAQPESQLGEYLHRLAERTGAVLPSFAESDGDWMTWDMIREMHANGMTIGAHTVSHPILTRLSPESQLDEILESRNRIAAELGETPRFFSYPIGKPATFDDVTKSALRTAGFEYAFSFYGGHQPFLVDQPYDIRRCSVGWRMSQGAFEAKVAYPPVFARW